MQAAGVRQVAIRDWTLPTRIFGGCGPLLVEKIVGVCHGSGISIENCWIEFMVIVTMDEWGNWPFG